MAEEQDYDTLLTLTADIVAAHVSNNSVAVNGGHGEIFVAQYRRPDFKLTEAFANLHPAAAAARIDAPLVVGNGAAALVAARGSGEAVDLLPAAANALALPLALRTLAPSPIYARPPDAIPAAAA